MTSRRHYHVFLLALILFFVSSLHGQKRNVEKPVLCTESPVNQGKYKVLSMSYGKELQFYLEIKRKHRTDANYIDTAKEFKEKYCREGQLRIIYYASKKNWLIADLKNPEATPLAIFFTGRETSEKEGISVYKIENGKVETRELSLPD